MIAFVCIRKHFLFWFSCQRTERLVALPPIATSMLVGPRWACVNTQETQQTTKKRILHMAPRFTHAHIMHGRTMGMMKMKHMHTERLMSNSHAELCFRWYVADLTWCQLCVKTVIHGLASCRPDPDDSSSCVCVCVVCKCVGGCVCVCVWEDSGSWVQLVNVSLVSPPYVCIESARLDPKKRERTHAA